MQPLRPLAAFGRPVGRPTAPDFTTALIAVAMWGLTPAAQRAIQQLGRVDGSLDADVSFATKADAPYYCDIEKVINDVGDTITVNRFTDQSGNVNHLTPPSDPPFFRYTSGDPLNGISILNAGTGDVNVDYLYHSDIDGKPAFSPDGISAPNTAGILWHSASGEWRIHFGGSRQYSSGEDVATPDLVTAWDLVGGANPLPNVFPTELLYAEVQFFA